MPPCYRRCDLRYHEPTVHDSSDTLADLILTLCSLLQLLQQTANVLFATGSIESLSRPSFRKQDIASDYRPVI